MEDKIKSLDELWNELHDYYGYENTSVVEEFYDTQLESIAHLKGLPGGVSEFNNRAHRLERFIDSKLARLLAQDTTENEKKILPQITRARKHYKDLSISEVYGMIIDTYF